MLSPIEKHAVEVLDALAIKTLPVDVFEIARREKIELCPIKADDKFLGRIEFHPEVNRFLLFYPENRFLQNGRLRFSLGNELAHYYLPEHHAHLRAGHFHNSKPGFICDKGMEREADEFSAALLLPGAEMKARLRKHDFLTLTQVLKLAEDAKTSRECAAIRYSKFTEETCVVVVAQDGKVLYSITSDEAGRRRMGLRKGTDLPVSALAHSAKSNDTAVDGKGDLAAWCPNTFTRGQLWQEVICLGNKGRTLTLLSLGSEEKEEDEEESF